MRSSRNPYISLDVFECTSNFFFVDFWIVASAVERIPDRIATDRLKGHYRQELVQLETILNKSEISDPKSNNLVVTIVQWVALS
jgi:hypothetical protein